MRRSLIERLHAAISLTRPCRRCGNRLANPLENHRDALADADAHGGQAELGVAVAHGVDEGGGDAGAARAERVADGDGAAADVDFSFVHLEHADAGQRLGGEGFVELDEVDVGQLEAGALERFLRGGHGAGAHHGRGRRRRRRWPGLLPAA